jgi:hypothetical protein
MQEIIGDNGMSAVLNTGRLGHWIGVVPPVDFETGLTFREVGNFFEALEAIYGVRNGTRLARQAGNGSFKHWIKGFGSIIGVADFILSIFPITLRARIGIEVLAEILSRYANLQVNIQESRDDFILTMEPAGFCWGRHTEAPACSYFVGLLEEVLFWISRGRRFNVEEVACIACGDTVCRFNVDKQVST